MQRIPILLLSIIGFMGFAQNTNRFSFEHNHTFSVIENGDSLINAFAGGLNLAQFSEIDLDLDGTKDLVVFDREGNKILPFLTKTNQGQKRFKFAPELIDSFPKVEGWMLLVDFDCDGKEDIFSFSRLGTSIKVWKNTSTPNSLSFAWALGSKKYLETTDGIQVFNLYNLESDIPGIIDLDNDNKLEILTFGQGSSVTVHSSKIPCGLDMEIIETCWGNFRENALNNSLALQDSICLNTTPKANPASGASPENGVHSGSSLIVLDLNQDNKKDILIGDVSFTNAVAAFNNAGNKVADMTSQDSIWPMNGVQVDLDLFPAFFYVDTDFDGKKDLVTVPNLHQGQNHNNHWVYKNSGSNASPYFQYNDSTFLFGEMLDFGESAFPAFADVDLDGKLDFVSGNYGKYQSSGNYDVRLRYYENKSNQNGDKFELLNNNLGNIAGLGLGNRPVPTIADITGDLIPEMIVGMEDGKIHLFSHNQNFLNPDFTLTTPNYLGIDIGDNAAPTLFDIDKDGDIDLVIGRGDGKLTFYENTGTSQVPNFVFITNNLGGVDLSSPFSLNGNAHPTLFEDSGKVYLAVGSQDRGVFQFDSIQSTIGAPAEIEFQVGNGNQVSQNYDETPLGTSKRWGRNQFLVKASDLLAAGFQPGNISEIHMDITTSGNPILSNDFRIKLALTNQNDLSGFLDPSKLAKVFQNPIGPSPGWNIFQITPFQWDGISNLVVECSFEKNYPLRDIHVKGHNTSYNSNAFADFTGATLATHGDTLKYKGNSTFLPNFKFKMIPAFKEVAPLYQYGHMNAPTIADLNGDGYPDMLVGNQSGGLILLDGIEFNDLNIAERQKVSGLKIYPNPNRGTFQIQGDLSWNGLIEIQVYNLSGQVVYATTSTPQKSIEIELNNLPSGVYIIKASDKKHNFIGRIQLISN